MTDDPPLAGADFDEIFEWLSQPPSRLEFYRVAVALLDASKNVVQGSMAMVVENRTEAVDHLQAAVDGLGDALRLMPKIDNAVIEAYDKREAERDNG